MSHAAMFAKQHNKNTPNWSCFCIHWGFCVLKHCRRTFDVMVNGRYKNYGHSYIPAESSFSIKKKKNEEKPVFTQNKKRAEDTKTGQMWSILDTLVRPLCIKLSGYAGSPLFHLILCMDIPVRPFCI